MGIWKRLAQGLGGGKRDPVLEAEREVNQRVGQLQADLLTLRQGVAEAIALQKRLERERHTAQGQVDFWYTQARDALARGMETEAVAALEKWQPYRKIVEQVDGQLGQRRELVQRLRGTLAQLEQRVMEARRQRDLLMARSRSAAAILRVRESLDSITGEGARALEQFEAEVQILEVQADLVGLTDGDYGGGRSQDDGAIARALSTLETELNQP
ncbi:MAG: PspA/IM30 family protein [Cyanobacteria bacterium P01_D01_bin.73]